MGRKVGDPAKGWWVARLRTPAQRLRGLRCFTRGHAGQGIPLVCAHGGHGPRE